MLTISAEEFSLWEKKQILKGGDKQSLSLLIDLLGGLSKNEFNLLKIKSEKKVEIISTKKNIDVNHSIKENNNSEQKIDSSQDKREISHQKGDNKQNTKFNNQKRKKEVVKAQFL